MPIGHPDTALELARALLIWEDQRQRDAERGHVQRPCRFEAEQEAGFSGESSRLPCHRRDRGPAVGSHENNH
jgi:hypothetical protein